MLKLTIEEAQTICLSRNVSFFSYRLPGKKGRHFGAQLEGEVECFRSLREAMEGFVVVPYNETSATPPLFIRQDIGFCDETEDREIIQALCHCKPGRSEIRSPESSVTPEEYNLQVTSMITALRDGFARKAVLARGVTLKVSGIKNAVIWFKNLELAYPDAFVFLVSVPGGMTWMGASPEIFLSRNGDRVETMALAGTRPAGSITWGHKEIEEQAIVTDYIAEILSGYGNWNVCGPFSKRAGGIEHLCTTFSSGGSLTNAQVERIRLALHPTPAVGGFPRAEAMELIQKTEGEHRRYYAGYTGPLHADGTFHWYVNLRSMEIFPEAVRLYVGGGITALSDPQKEWRETELKSMTLLDIMEKRF